jgi:hypothetical protein
MTMNPPVRLVLTTASIYMHYWAVDDAVTLAKVLRPALDATNLQPPA